MKANQFKQVVISLAAISAVAITVPTIAEGFYIGAGVSQAFIDERGFDEDDTGSKLFGGYQLNDYLAIEGAYYDFGDINDGSSSTEIDGLSAAIVGKLPVSNHIALFGKVGGHEWDADVTGAASGQISSDSDSDAFYGLGVEYNISQSISLRAEVERYEVEDLDVDVATVGLSFNF
ncbi:MAG: outer membrane beta-barrel protein [Acidiferrobacterales bacterium]|nr:outer membrane beta-barrel protein [Acidiferrobacterales bacterium]